MQKVLEIYNVKNSKYPNPDKPTNITYSGSTAWTQGIFGISAYTDGSSMSNIPVDPVTGLEYPYSRTANGKEYSMATILEQPTSQLLTQATFAGTQEAQVVIKGNYNGKFIKVRANSTTYILGVPSILASDITNVDLVQILNNKKLVYNGFKNLPASFSGSIYKTDGGFNFTPNKLILFQGDINSLEKNPSARNTFLNNLQANYTGSIIKSAGGISELLAIDPTSTSASSNYVATVLNNSLKTNIPLEKISLTNGPKVDISCSGLMGDISANNGLSPVNLCNNVNELVYNIEFNNTLTAGSYDVYGIYLNAGTTYVTYLDKADTVDKVMFLFNNTGGNEVDDINGDLYNDDDPEVIYFTPTSSGIYYYLVMGYDNSEFGNYSIQITKKNNCVAKPNYPNANFMAGIPFLDNTPWQNIDLNKGCYYTCQYGFTGNDCNTNINPAIMITGVYNGYSKVWSYNSNGGTLYSYDTSTGNQVDSILGAASNYIVGTVLDKVNNSIYVMNYGTATVRKYNTNTLQYISSPLTVYQYARSLFKDTYLNYFYNGGGNSANTYSSKVNTSNDSTTTCNFGYRPRTLRISTNKIFVGESGGNNIRVYNKSNCNFEKEFALTLGLNHSIQYLTYDYERNILWGVGLSEQKLYRINLNNDIVSEIYMPINSYGIGFDPVNDLIFINEWLYGSNKLSQNIAIIDATVITGLIKIVGTYDRISSPYKTIIIDPSTGEAFSTLR